VGILCKEVQLDYTDSTCAAGGSVVIDVSVSHGVVDGVGFSNNTIIFRKKLHD
jgi:hypothetical protein